MKQKMALLTAMSAGLFSVVYSGVSMALSTADNTAVSAAFDSGATSVGTVVTGVIAIGAVMTGLALVYNWLKK